MSEPVADAHGPMAAHLIGRPVDELPTPAAVVDLATLRRNIAGMAELTRSFGVALRPHWKSSKSVDVARLQLAAGAVGFTAATAAEVQALVAGGIDDVFWAYAPIGTPRVRVALDAARRIRLLVGTDSVDAVAELSSAAADAGLTVGARLEVDTGLGRTGVAPDDAVELARRLSALPGLLLEGVYTHEGQVQGKGADAEARQAAGLAAGRVLVEVASAVRDDGIPLRSVSVGSTPGVRTAPSVPGVTEARPGTYVYGDENQVAIGTIAPEDCALTVLSRVVSLQRSDRVIVDAGVKGMSSDASLHGDGRVGTVVGEDGRALGFIVSAGYEEHGAIAGLAGVGVGDLVRLRPNHACGLSNMYSRVYAIDDGLVAHVWPVTGRH